MKGKQSKPKDTDGIPIDNNSTHETMPESYVLNPIKSALSAVKFDDALVELKSFEKSKKNGSNMELEFSFFNRVLTRETNKSLHELQILPLLDYFSREHSAKNELALDVIVGPYRFTIKGEEVPTFYGKNWNKTNHEILGYFDSHQSDKLEIMEKTKKNVTDSAEFDFRFKKAVEINKSYSSIKHELQNLNASGNVIFRKKHRVSFELDGMSLDITHVYQSNTIDFTKSAPFYEVELEVTSVHKNLTSNLCKAISAILCQVHSVQNVVPKNVKEDLTKKLRMSNNAIYIRKAIPLDDNPNQSLTLHDSYNDTVASLRRAGPFNSDKDKWMVTPKLDGQRMNLIIDKASVAYFVDPFLPGTIVWMDESISSLKLPGDSVFDGEYMSDGSFHVFDAMKINGEDISELPLLERLEKIEHCIPFQEKGNDRKSKGKWKSLLTATKREQLETEIEEYYRTIKGKKLILKFYYDFATISSNSKEKRELVKTFSELVDEYCLYHLDGFIYTSVNHYNTTEFKEKPVNLNGIEFYLEYSKDESGNSVYANTIQEKTYQKCRIYCSNSSQAHKMGFDLYVPFEVPTIPNADNILLEVEKTPDGCILTDSFGNFVPNWSVVELTYDRKEPIYEMRWKLHRLRKDKTQSVIYSKSRYGNNIKVAQDIFKELSSIPPSYSSTKEQEGGGPYYTKTTDLGLPSRKFHNTIKRDLITWAASLSSQSVLDLACGRGGDLNKYVSSGFRDIYMIDNDAKGLLEAKERYRSIKQPHKRSSKVVFLKYNFTSKLNLPIHFDTIQCHFAIHYAFDTLDHVKMLLENVSNHLKPNGTFVVTCMDDSVLLSLTETTEIRNESQLIFKVHQEYKKDESNKQIGCKIQVTNCMIDDKPKTEYLVPKAVLVSEANSVGLELIEDVNFIDYYKTKYTNREKKVAYRDHLIEFDSNTNYQRLSGLFKFYKFVKASPKL
jgi:mRNA (guanine-N7-)-methyltransferase